MAKEKKQINWEACYKYIQGIFEEVEKELESSVKKIYQKPIHIFIENYPPRIILSFERPYSMRSAFLKDKEYNKNIGSVVEAMEEVARNKELRIEKERVHVHQGRVSELEFTYAFKPDYNTFRVD